MLKISALALSALLVFPSVASAQVSGGQTPRESAGSLRPGEPRPPRPVRRESFDKVVTAMFRKGDSNRDGTIAVAELRAVIEARRDTVVRERFSRIDSNRNGAISPEEFSAWQKGLGSLALNEATAFGNTGEIVAEMIVPDAGDDPDDVMLANLILPLNATVIAQANTNFDGGASLEELIAFEGKRFEAADSNKDGFLTLDELRPTRPNAAAGQRPPSGG